MNLSSRHLFVCLYVHPPVSEEGWRDYLQIQIFFDGECALRLRGRQIAIRGATRWPVSESSNHIHHIHHPTAKKRIIIASTRHPQTKPSTTVLGSQVCTQTSPPPDSLHQRGKFVTPFHSPLLTYGSFATPPQH